MAILFELLSLGCSDPRLLEEVGDLGVYESFIATANAVRTFLIPETLDSTPFFP